MTYRWDRITPLREHDVVGRLEADLEAALLADPSLANEVARTLVEAEFPPSLITDVLTAAGLEPEDLLGGATVLRLPGRRRSARWPDLVLEAWDRQCAFCGFDGQLAGSPVGLEAAHIRWFNSDGPDELDNGLALCSLHHKLFDRGVLGISFENRIQVSQLFSTRSETGRLVYELHGRELTPRPGTQPPSPRHLGWHADQVFKGEPLAA